ncbi:phage tail sheath C-terminal domain-containing protein [Actinopolymorpha singaporensis]|uniref:Tail sheath protein C-terminal domain-containing protein n=1 Tax=Actinopolymorpha singaporensis TaxID=117157 RepID=A0A1H1UY34_9ACTN|nr:phage tail sheath C-terminal domain-containing protein [Actinopolymorpha singaporensis]SDS77434.1 hypothetical protein SAMN04489717_3825 [Actinopolymorpha singaporensis]
MTAPGTGGLGGLSGLGGLGAPGVLVAPPEPVRAITGVRRDVTAFAGIAPRGPVREPVGELLPDTDLAVWLTGPKSRSVAVPVTSWDEYRYAFGGFEGPGRLPYAVAAFFAQGGERAWVVRVVHDYGSDDDAGRAVGPLGSLVTTEGDQLQLSARSEGAWGNRLRATLSFTARPVPVLAATSSELVVTPYQEAPIGSLVRVRLPGDLLQLRFVDRVEDRPDPAGPGLRRYLLLDVPLASAPAGFDLVTGVLAVTDADPLFPREETLAGLGLRADHPRWVGRALVTESTLLQPTVGWAGGTVDLAEVDPTLPPVEAALAGGRDRWDDVVPEDFWDPGWVPGDERPGSGVHCLAENDEVALLAAPDLYDPAPIAPTDDVRDPPTVAGPDFAVCVELSPPAPAPDPPPPGLSGLALDPQVPADLDRIVAAQQALVAFAEIRRDLTVLLDVPLGLPHRRILQWRNAFDSPHAAAYHPWLDVAAPDDARDTLVRVNPSAFAAGIVADRELRLGVPTGPSNQVAIGPVRVSSTVTRNQHDELHADGINVFLADRDGIRLTGARTLSRRAELRQLSVARLMTVLRLSLERELDWAVFEPNGDALWDEVRRMVAAYLARLYAAGAFTGATAQEAFFVRCDRTTMTPNDLDNGRFVCLVGVAPAEPVEYLVLRLARDRDDTVRVEAV